MRPSVRKIIYAITFEAGGIILAGLALTLMSDAGGAKSLSLAAVSAAIAMLWSLIFNTGFEAWEARQPVKGRPPLRRVVHACLFEGGLLVFLLPATAWWLDATIWDAMRYEAILIVVFLVYAWAFTLAFDWVFGLPNSAK
jgi:uncharacterized membrane protein